MKLPPFRETTTPRGQARIVGAGSWMAGLAAVLVAATAVTVLLVSRANRSPAGPASAPQASVTASPVVTPDALSTAPFRCLSGEGLGAGPSVSVAEVARVVPATGDGYDRLVIEFSNGPPSEASLSIQTGAVFSHEGQPVKLEGAYGALLTLQPADGSKRYSGPLDLRPRYSVITEVREIEDSGGIVRWAIGLSRAPCYRLAYLTDPPRVEVDFQAG